MTDIRSLEQTLFDNLPWNKARIKCVTRFLLALYAVRTVNLSILATAFSGHAKEESNYKRLQRFLREFELPYAELAAFVVREWQAVVKELKLKKHGYPPKSIFRLGLNLLCRLVTNFEHFDVAAWNRVIKLLSCT